jgi:hypothetical protein
MKNRLFKWLLPSTAIAAVAMIHCSSSDESNLKAIAGGASGAGGSAAGGGGVVGGGGSSGSAGDAALGSGGFAGDNSGGTSGGGAAGTDTGGGGFGAAGVGGSGGSGGVAGSGGTADVGGSGGSGGTGGGGTGGSGGTTAEGGLGEAGVAPATYTDAKGIVWKLVWHDEFDGPTLNNANWAAQDGPNNANQELEYYRPGNATIQNGALVLEAREEAYGGKNYTSGKISSRNKQSFTYGRISARIQLPATVGMWPAFWMLGTGGRWPVDGELDIMEARGRVPNSIDGTAHWGTNNANYGKSYAFPSGTDISTYHVYTLEWSATTLSWSVDDAPVYVTMSPIDACFTKSFYFIFNLAVGGSFDGNKTPPAGMANQQMLVDWVRVYQLP